MYVCTSMACGVCMYVCVKKLWLGSLDADTVS